MPEKEILQLYLQQALDLKILQKPVDIDDLVSSDSWKNGESPVR